MSRLSPERVALAREIIDRYPVAGSAMIPLVHLAQEQDGYVADDAMEHIAELIGCTPAEVYGTASFYEMFKFHPVGRYVVGVCTNISCLLMGADELIEHCERSLGVRVGGTTDDAVFTLEDVECVAACTVAPCVQVNYRYFPDQTPETIDKLFADLRAGRLDDEVPPHGVLARVRQYVEPARWAGSGTASPRTPETFPDPVLAERPAAGQVDHGATIGRTVSSPTEGGPETAAGRPADRQQQSPEKSGRWWRRREGGSNG